MLRDHLPVFRKSTKISAVYENKFHADETDSRSVLAAAIEVILYAGSAVSDWPVDACVVHFTGDAVKNSHVVIASVIVSIIMSSLLTPSSRWVRIWGDIVICPVAEQRL